MDRNRSSAALLHCYDLRHENESFQGAYQMTGELQELQTALKRFAEERDWDQFHSPKNLASALSVETAELLEHFQWLTGAQSRSLPDEKKAAVARF